MDSSKSLACIHCGLCLSSCPTYLETGNENDSPRGRIYLMRAVQDGRLPLEKSVVQHFDRCLGCRACEAVCPSGVEYGALLEATRDHVEKRYHRSGFQRFLRRVAIERLFPYPWRMRAALQPARMVRALKLMDWLPKFAQEAMSLIPETISDIQVPEHSPTPKKRVGRLGFVGGCVMPVMFGSANIHSIDLLNQLGYDVVAPFEQGCCGALYSHGGNLDAARECARKNIAAFEKLDLDAIIINAAGCGSTLKEYGHLLHDDREWVHRAEAFSRKVKDLTEWLAYHSVLPLKAYQGRGRITYHDACHLAHAQRITKQPRDLVKRIAGSAFVELPESDVCCGSAGSYNLTEPEMAARLQKRKVDNILATGAEIVVTSNPGCLLQIQAGLKEAGPDIRVMHIADFLAEYLDTGKQN